MRSHSVTDNSAAVFHALAHPIRRAVLDLLRGETLPAGQIARSFPISRPAISKHLRLLRHADLVREYRRGRHRLYRLNPRPLKAVDQWLSHCRGFWSAKLLHVKTFANPATHLAAQTSRHPFTENEKHTGRGQNENKIYRRADRPCPDALRAPAGRAQSSAQQSFEALKTVAGKWQGKDTLGHGVMVTFRVTAKGSALALPRQRTGPNAVPGRERSSHTLRRRATAAARERANAKFVAIVASSPIRSVPLPVGGFVIVQIGRISSNQTGSRSKGWNSSR